MHEKHRDRHSYGTFTDSLFQFQWSFHGLPHHESHVVRYRHATYRQSRSRNGDTHSMIAVNDTLLSTLDMSVLTADGAYALYIRFDNDSVFQKSFGYYTNGYPLEERIDIRILPDTLIFSAQF
jgi:hypothetical protein